MKALYCVNCGDIIAPLPRANEPRWCQCGRHAVWWRDPFEGLLSVHDTQRIMQVGIEEDGREIAAPPSWWSPAAFVLGLVNSWLTSPHEPLTAEDYRQFVLEIPPSYIFRTVGSVAIRFRPGESRDTRWDDLPIQRSAEGATR